MYIRMRIIVLNFQYALLAPKMINLLHTFRTNMLNGQKKIKY